MEQNEIDVIMACYNSEHTVERTIQSVLCQTHLNKFYIIDDASTDSTESILQTYENHPKIFVIYNKINKGLAFCLNLALKTSNATFVSRIDADDLMGKNRLQEHLIYFNKYQNVDVVASNATIRSRNRTFQTKLPETNSDISKALLRYNPILHPTVSFKRQTILEVGGYNEKFIRAQDFELWKRCADSNIKFINLKNYDTVIHENLNRSLKSIFQEVSAVQAIAIKQLSLRIFLYSFRCLLLNFYKKLLFHLT